MLNAFGHTVEWCWFNFILFPSYENQCWTRLATLLNGVDSTFLSFSGVNNYVERVWPPSSTSYNKVEFNCFERYWILFSKFLYPTLTQSLLDFFHLAGGDRNTNKVMRPLSKKITQNGLQKLKEAIKNTKNTTGELLQTLFQCSSFWAQKTGDYFWSHFRSMQTLTLWIHTKSQITNCYLFQHIKRCRQDQIIWYFIKWARRLHNPHLHFQTF